MKIKYKSMLTTEKASYDGKYPDTLLVNMHGTKIVYLTAIVGNVSILELN